MPGCSASKRNAVSCGSGRGGAPAPTEASCTGLRGCCTPPLTTLHRYGRQRAAEAVGSAAALPPPAANPSDGTLSGGTHFVLCRNPPAWEVVCITKPYSSLECIVAHSTHPRCSRGVCARAAFCTMESLNVSSTGGSPCSGVAVAPTRELSGSTAQHSTSPRRKMRRRSGGVKPAPSCSSSSTVMAA